MRTDVVTQAASLAADYVLPGHPASTRGLIRWFENVRLARELLVRHGWIPHRDGYMDGVLHPELNVFMVIWSGRLDETSLEVWRNGSKIKKQIENNQLQLNGTGHRGGQSERRGGVIACA